MPRDLFAQPLFSPKLIKTRFPSQPLPEAHRQVIAGWAAQLKGGLGQVKEEAIRTSFLRLFFTPLFCGCFGLHAGGRLAHRCLDA